MNTNITDSFSPALIEATNDYYSVSQKRRLLPAWELSELIERYTFNERASQKKIYQSFYGYAMAVCKRYANSDDAAEILNDGFLKMFKQLYHYKPAYIDVAGSFKAWLRKIMIHTAIDHFRKNHKNYFKREAENEIIKLSAAGEDALDRISYQELIRSVQQLTPGYRTVFNLFIIDGFSHEEISEQLGISIGTSKSNLAKARRQLQKILLRHSQIQVLKNSQDLVPVIFANVS
ncbi:MAG: sigma-70 family RNA polymerase sigma factor [Ferruginibacter sp.]